MAADSLIVTRDDLSTRLRELDLAEYEAAIQAVARPGLAVNEVDVDDDNLPIGFTKIGGRPDMDAAIPWPTKTYANDKRFSYLFDDGRFTSHLFFLAQFNLADLAPYQAASALPKTGLLSFFYDVEKQPWACDTSFLGAWRVIYEPQRENLARRDLPRELEDGLIYQIGNVRSLNARGLSFTPFLSLPNEWCYHDADGFKYWKSDEAGFSVAESDLGKLEALYRRPFQIGHQLFGHPNVIQNPMEAECELVARAGRCLIDLPFEEYTRVSEDAKAWRLLFQLNSLQEMSFGDLGILYFWIREDDLASASFDKTWMISQC